MGAASAMMRCRPGEYGCLPRGYEKEVLPYPLGTVADRCRDGSRQTPLLVTSPPCAWLGAGRKALVAEPTRIHLTLNTLQRQTNHWGLDCATGWPPSRTKHGTSSAWWARTATSQRAAEYDVPPIRVNGSRCQSE